VRQCNTGEGSKIVVIRYTISRLKKITRGNGAPHSLFLRIIPWNFLLQRNARLLFLTFFSLEKCKLFFIEGNIAIFFLFSSGGIGV
jgi:hypothetical protein